MNNEMRFRFLGNTDEVTTCDCCGRSDLKATVALEDECGTVVHYGVVCAARAMKLTATEVRRGARKADDDKRRAEEAARTAAWRAEYNAFQMWLDARVAPKGDRFRQLEALGGYKAARAAYEAETAVRAA